MRKAQREIKDIHAILDVLDRCQTIRMALNGDTFPYIVPLSFGWEQVDGKIFIYFHCAKEGKKIDLIAENNAVCLETDLLDGYVKTERGVTADYKSVIARGYAEQVFGEHAMHGIELLLKHCGIEGYSAKNCVLTNAVAVYKITIEEITGKARFAENPASTQAKS